MRQIDDSDLFYLRSASREWLQEHPDSKNAPHVKDALEHTKDLPVVMDRVVKVWH